MRRKPIEPSAPINSIDRTIYIRENYSDMESVVNQLEFKLRELNFEIKIDPTKIEFETDDDYENGTSIEFSYKIQYIKSQQEMTRDLAEYHKKKEKYKKDLEEYNQYLVEESRKSSELEKIKRKNLYQELKKEFDE